LEGNRVECYPPTLNKLVDLIWAGNLLSIVATESSS